MDEQLDTRTYDLLRLVDRHGPIGSIRLVELMDRRGYDIQDRTIRLTLADLDAKGFTEKVPGRGRRLTERGRHELEQGDVRGRLEEIRAKIATLTSRVNYDPLEDSGELVASSAILEEGAIEDALGVIERLHTLPFGPLPVGLERLDEDTVRLFAASSITLDGVLLSRGINADLSAASVLEYTTDLPAEEDEPRRALAEYGGHLVRHVDVIDGEGSSIDVISLLIEAGRGSVSPVLDGESTGLLVGDDRRFPIVRFEETRDLTIATRSNLGGVVDFQRPGEGLPAENGNAAWAYGSVTYVGAGELLIQALHERGLLTDWEPLYGTVPRNRLSVVDAQSHLAPGAE
ncbi:MAG: NrpR regulatory domain-containing protein [Halanaeroarchaeum sp.]